MLLFLILFLVTMALGFPIAFAMLLASLYFIVSDSGSDLIIVPQQIQDGLNSFPFLAIPFFVLAGNLMAEAGVINRFVQLAQSLIGHVRGGLAHAVILSGALLSGVSGSGTADAAALGSTMIPALEKQGYKKDFAVVLCAFSGALGPIIPPSIFLIIYGAMGNVSIGQLFLAGVVPGILMVLVLMATSHIVVTRKGYGVQMPKTTLAEKGLALKHAAFDLVLPLGIIGGIRFGIFTPTEAGAVAVLYVLFIGLVVQRSLSFAQILKAARETVDVLGAVMLLIAMATIVNYILALFQASDHLAAAVVGLSSNPIMFLILTNLLVIFLGSIIEDTAVLVLMTPILVPLLDNFHIDPVHFGMVLCMNLTIGLVAPPVGLAMFVTCSIGQISIERFMRESWPFLLALLLLLLALIVFPSISLWLPHQMVHV
ncbi:MAG TPA: TRAP transporter large permease [Mesorhizobium sp.]